MMIYIKYFASILFVFSSLIYCLGQDVILTSQAEVDAFDPSTTIINGYLFINGSSSDSITNLNNLSNLTSIDGYLRIEGNASLTDIDDLSNLASFNGNLNINNNAALTNIDGLLNLASSIGFLTIEYNHALINIDGLSNLTTTSGNIRIRYSNALADLTGLSNLVSTGGQLWISDNPSLTNMNGLSSLTSTGGNLYISNNASLTDITGLSNLTSLGIFGSLTIRDNASLTNTGDFPNLTSLGQYGNLYIGHNALLTDITGLSNLASIGGYLTIIDNASLENIDGGLANLTSIDGYLRIEDNASLMNIDGLFNLTSIGEDLWITYNPSLTNIDGLSNLTVIGEFLEMHDNIALTDCCGIQNLLNIPEAISGPINIYNNPSECNSKNEIANAVCNISIDSILSNSSMPPCTPVANGIYVDHTASGANDGSSWMNAFTDLQVGINQASGACSTIYVAEGVYKPTNTTSRGIFFTMDKNLNIYGGFPNGGGDADPEVYPTILSGDIDNDGTLSGNSFHVIQVKNAATVSLHNLTIQDGNADNANSFARARGGGIYVNGANLNLANCKVINNKAVFGGGIFSTLSSQTYLLNCLVDSNEAENGSAIYHSNQTNLYLIRTKILNNNSTTRCAIEVNNSLYTYIENSIIANNPSTNANALALIATNRNQTCDIYNSTILGETKNKNLITLQVGFGDELNFNINNSIVAHQNLSFDKNVKEFNNGILNFNHNNCYFQGASVIGTGTNALFSDIAGDLLLNADYSVDACSPVIDSGDNTYTTGLLTDTDIATEPRIYNWSIVDIGAFEHQGTCLVPRFGETMEHTNQIDYTIYPNPTRGMVYISSESEEILVSLYDILGKEIIPMESRNVLNLRNLAKGTYLMHIHDGEKFLGVEKLIKY